MKVISELLTVSLIFHSLSYLLQLFSVFKTTFRPMDSKIPIET